MTCPNPFGLGIVAAAGQAVGAVLSRHGQILAAEAGQPIDGLSVAYQRIFAGLVFTLVWWFWARRNRIGTPPTGPLLVRAAVPWILLNAFSGPSFGVAAYQWALQLQPTGIVVAISALTPLAVIPLSPPGRNFLIACGAAPPSPPPAPWTGTSPAFARSWRRIRPAPAGFIPSTASDTSGSAGRPRSRPELLDSWMAFGDGGGDRCLYHCFMAYSGPGGSNAKLVMERAAVFSDIRSNVRGFQPSVHSPALPVATPLRVADPRSWSSGFVVR